MLIKNLSIFQDRSKFILAVNNGYAICNELIKQNNIFEFEIGKQLIPYIKNASVEYILNKMIEEKRLIGYACHLRQNKAKNCAHLEIESDELIMTVSHVRNEYDVPRNACFRNQLSINNVTLPLFKDDNESDILFNDKKYVVLTHGHGNVTPDFINLGIPFHAEKSWCDVVNLLKTPHETENNDEVIILEEDITKLVELIKNDEILKKAGA